MADSPRARSRSRTRGSGRYYAPSVGGGGGGAFDPATLTGVLHWLRAKDGLVTVPAYISAVTASSSFSAAPTALVNGAIGTAWDTNGTASGWVRIQLSAAVALNKYAILARGDQLTRNPKDWTFEGSNDGSSWTVLDTRTSITGWGARTLRSYTFTNSTAYSYYRLNVSANNGDGYLSMAQLWFGDGFPLAANKGWVDAKVGTTLFSNSASGPTITAAATPSSGQAVTFSGAEAIHWGGLIGTAFEVWIVLKVTRTAGTQNALWTLGDVSDQSYFPYSDGKVYEDAGLPSGQRQQFTPSLAVNGNWRLYRVANDGTTWQAWIDNTSQLTASSKAVTWARYGNLGNNIGNTVGGSTYFMGQIAEVLLRDQVSTSGEVSSLISYFNTEHGLTVT